MSKTKRSTERTSTDLEYWDLAIREKFTTLRKGIANRSDIVNAVKNIGFKALLIAITLLNSSVTLPLRDYKVDTIVIDPGHGGKDPGTHGKIAKDLPDVKVIYTRKDDRYIPLDERAEIANKHKADLFICIHANAIVNAVAYGTETYVMGLHKDQSNMDVAKRENSVITLDANYQERYEGFDPKSPESYILFELTQGAYKESSLLFAQKIEEQFKNKVGRSSRGVKQAGFWVLWRTAMPSVLIETGFLSHVKEEAYLNSAEGQDLIASGIYRAFKVYKTQIEAIN
jgi:N-acetylmuramoyl-L-alanine amidase